MLRRAVLLVALFALVLAGGIVVAARQAPALATGDPVGVSGTEASAVFTIGYRTVRQVRYADGGTLRYTFRLVNEGQLPVTVQGLAEEQTDPRLFTYVALTGADGASAVRLGPGDEAPFTLSLAMGGCESLSARAGSFVTEVSVRTRQAGLFHHDVRVTLPEQIHTGSPREAFCPRSTATSRPPG